MEQKSELEAKTELASNPEINALPLNPDEMESEHLKEAATELKSESAETDEEAGKKAGSTPSVQDDEKSNELEKVVAEQENELGAKVEVAAKPETNALFSNPDEDDSKEMK